MTEVPKDYVATVERLTYSTTGTEWISHKDTKMLKQYMTKNNREAEQAAFDDALF